MNEKQLLAQMEKLAREALSDTVKEVLEIYQRDYIMGIAYIKDPTEYNRTWEFKESWEFKEIKKKLFTLFTELWYNPEKMKTFDPDNFIHGSIYSTPPDIRNNLPAILEGKQSSLWISVFREKKFWQEFIKDMVAGGKLDKIMEKHFRKKGFVKA